MSRCFECLLCSVLWVLLRLAGLLALVWFLLQVNLHLAVASFQSFAALHATRAATQALSQAVQAAADSTAAAQSAAEIAQSIVASPPLLAQTGGFAYLMPEAINLLLRLTWKPPGALTV